jgi:Rod binding domain-containing protein
MGSLNISGPGLSPLDLLTSAQTTKAPSAFQARAKDAAQNFEAVFLNTMFNSMFTDVGGDGPFGGSGATGVWRSMLTDQYARNIAKAGGIGIAPHVYQSLMAQQEVKG